MAESIPIRKEALAKAEKTLGADDPRTIEYANDLSAVLKLMGRHDEAAIYAERAVKSQERMIKAKRRATPEDLMQLGHIYTNAEKYDKAEYAYKQVLALQEKLLGPNHQDLALTLSFLSTVYGFQERYAEEALVRQRELAIRERYTDPMGPTSILLAYTILISNYDALGRYREAEALSRREIAFIEKDRSLQPLLSSSFAGLASVLSNQGRYLEAEKLFKRAVALDRANPMPAAMQAADPFSPENSNLGCNLQFLAEVQYKLGRLDEAEKAAREALPLCISGEKGVENASVVPTLIILARIQKARGKLDDAQKLYARAMPLVEKFSPQTAQMAHLLADIAELKLAQGRVPEAYELARRGTGILIRRFQLLSAAFAMTPNGQSRPTNLLDRPIFYTHLNAAAELANREPAQAAQLAEESFEIAQWAQSSQAAAALSQMAARFAKGEGELAQTVRQRQDLVNRYKATDRKLVESIAKPDQQRDRAQEDAWHRSSQALERKIGEIDAALAKKFPDYAALTSPAPLPAKELQAILRPDEALYQVFADDAQSFAWVVTRDAIRWRKLPVGSAALAKEVIALRCGLDASLWKTASGGAASAPNRCRELLGISAPPRALPFDLARSHALYTTLLAPFEDLIAKKHLIFVMSGPLTTLPPQVLVTKSPGAALAGIDGYAKAAWLGVQQPVSVLPSVSSIKSLRATARNSTAPNPLVAFANPLLSGADGTDKSAWSHQSCATPAGSPVQQVALAAPRGAMQSFFRGALADVDVLRKQPPLPETADEVCSVASDLRAPPEVVFLGAKATEARIKALSASGTLKSYRVLHFATHGLVAGETQSLVANMAEPALLLTPPQTATEEDDGLLTASEVARLNINADWVILSACNTAAADGAPGAEALSGLASSFLYAGTRSLIVSHWYVNSEAAVQLITGTFGALRKQPGISRAEALRQSMELRVREGGQRAHPSYWAPFVIVGEGG